MKYVNKFKQYESNKINWLKKQGKNIIHYKTVYNVYVFV